MIKGTASYDDVPDVRCTVCGGYFKADEPEAHDCGEKGLTDAKRKEVREAIRRYINRQLGEDRKE
ncbi:hypothetical protein [Pluralibacter gergoviae]|uniref:hypothetical protein n=1 Tax=Pluralibacter gergoviae TaxID=61647 RepID=UPI00388F4625